MGRTGLTGEPKTKSQAVNKKTHLPQMPSCIQQQGSTIGKDEAEEREKCFFTGTSEVTADYRDTNSSYILLSVNT